MEIKCKFNNLKKVIHTSSFSSSETKHQMPDFKTVHKHIINDQFTNDGLTPTLFKMLFQLQRLYITE
jgi:hypothetical protein